MSLAALLPTERHPRGDRSVVRAHDEAVRATLDWVEETFLETRGWDPETRQRPRVKAPFMAAATFRHVASRNLDPQLHTHAVIANMTRDADGRWRSVDPIALHRNARLIGAYYRDRLARNLIGRGYSIVPAMAGRIPSFDIAGLGRELCEAFSTRRREILAYVEDRGWDGSEAQRQIATRGRKAEPLQGMLRTLWRERAEALGFGGVSVSRSGGGVSLLPVPSALEIVGRTVSRLEERYPVFAERELEALALGHSPGRHSLGDIREAVAWMVRDGHLVEAEQRGSDRSYVTDRTLKAERSVIAAMKAGLGAGEALAGADAVASQLAGAGLTAGQEDAVRRVLLSRDRIVGVQGWAGTGKTTMLRHVRELAAGRPVVGLAPSAEAARVLERESGMNVRTLQWFLTRCGSAIGDERAEERLKRMFGGALVVLDESSMVSTDQMVSLMRIADRLGVARLALVGDTKQLRAVDAGQSFLLLQRAGMTTVEMDESRRQRDPKLRAAVLASRSGEPGKAVELLGSSMHEVPFDELGTAAGRTWLALAPEARERTLLLAPTHALRAEINETVRSALANEGVLRGKALTIERLVSLGMTRAEKGDARNYREGDAVVFHQDMVNYRLKKDEALTVTVIEGERVALDHPDGGPRQVKPAGRVRYYLDVYEPRPIEIRAGDRIRWTRNDHGRGLSECWGPAGDRAVPVLRGCRPLEGKMGVRQRLRAADRRARLPGPCRFGLRTPGSRRAMAGGTDAGRKPGVRRPARRDVARRAREAARPHQDARRPLPAGLRAERIPPGRVHPSARRTGRSAPLRPVRSARPGGVRDRGHGVRRSQVRREQEAHAPPDGAPRAGEGDGGPGVRAERQGHRPPARGVDGRDRHRPAPALAEGGRPTRRRSPTSGSAPRRAATKPCWSVS